jgi:hypothetical protein
LKEIPFALEGETWLSIDNSSTSLNGESFTCFDHIKMSKLGAVGAGGSVEYYTYSGQIHLYKDVYATIGAEVGADEDIALYITLPQS